VAAIAKELGYSVHPMISAWISARRQGRAFAGRLPIAYLDLEDHQAGCQEVTEISPIFEGARDQADRRGFALTSFELAKYSRNPARLDTVFATRNIRGIMIGPSNGKIHLPDWEWSRFAIVAIGDEVEYPICHRVVNQQRAGNRRASEDQMIERSLGQTAADWLARLIVENSLGEPSERHTLLVESTAPSVMAACT
jgi:DNA-binding LacI/PurR family transcriptional regulator